MEWWRSGFVIVQSLYNIYYDNRLVPDWTLVKCLADVMLVCKKGKKKCSECRKPIDSMAGGAAHNNKCLSYFRKRYFFNSRLNTFEFQEGLFLLQLAGLSYHQTAKSSSTKHQLLLRSKIYTENCSIYYTSAQEKMKGFFPA
jgi:hypothetical protein